MFILGLNVAFRCDRQSGFSSLLCDHRKDDHPHSVIIRHAGQTGYSPPKLLYNFTTSPPEYYMSRLHKPTHHVRVCVVGGAHTLHAQPSSPRHQPSLPTSIFSPTCSLHANSLIERLVRQTAAWGQHGRRDADLANMAECLHGL